MERPDQQGSESEVRLARKMVANILWRSSGRCLRQEDGRSLITPDHLYLEFTTTYPDVSRPVFESGLAELARLGKVDLTHKEGILVDFTTLE
ncbi:MAG TPA: hypothetical protein VEF76_00095 [Patescibacteria group bacterium]|nr:hypothetical protein [Patescibacteria group bacterium]